MIYYFGSLPTFLGEAVSKALKMTQYVLLGSELKTTFPVKDILKWKMIINTECCLLRFTKKPVIDEDSDCWQGLDIYIA